MKKLTDLQQSAEGRAYLHREGIFVEPETFASSLEPPSQPNGLEAVLGRTALKPVYTGQQVYADMPWPVMNKFFTLIKLNRSYDLEPVFIWSDTDSCGSDKYTTRIFLPTQQGSKGFRLVDKRYNNHETRFTPLEHKRVLDAFARLEQGAIGSLRDKQKKDQIKRNARKILQLFEANTLRTIGDFNIALTNLMLGPEVCAAGAQVILSDLIAIKPVQESVNSALNTLSDYIKVQNEARAGLLRLEIDPVLPELSEDYLPFWYSCPIAGSRLKLHCLARNGDVWAITGRPCKCGEDHRFHLGGKQLSMEALAKTGRFSLDISFQIHLNDLFSGSVAGRSSGIYMIVLNHVLRRVLGRRPVPIFIPSDWPEPPSEASGLVYSYITGTRHQLWTNGN